jgi:glucuronate isomerase
MGMESEGIRALLRVMYRAAYEAHSGTPGDRETHEAWRRFCEAFDELERRLGLRGPDLD